MAEDMDITMMPSELSLSSMQRNDDADVADFGDGIDDERCTTPIHQISSGNPLHPPRVKSIKKMRLMPVETYPSDPDSDHASGEEVQMISAPIPHKKGVGVNSCVLCPEMYPSASALKEHMGTHEGVYYCKTCPLVFFQSSDLSAHVASAHSQFNCILCTKVYKSATTLRQHVESKHVIKNIVGPFICATCPRIFDNAVSLNWHLGEHALMKYLADSMIPNCLPYYAMPQQANQLPLPQPPPQRYRRFVPHVQQVTKAVATAAVATATAASTAADTHDWKADKEKRAKRAHNGKVKGVGESSHESASAFFANTCRHCLLSVPDIAAHVCDEQQQVRVPDVDNPQSTLIAAHRLAELRGFYETRKFLSGPFTV